MCILTSIASIIELKEQLMAGTGSVQEGGKEKKDLKRRKEAIRGNKLFKCLL